MGKGTITFSDEGDSIICDIAFDPPLDIETDKATPAQNTLMQKWQKLCEMADEDDEADDDDYKPDLKTERFDVFLHRVVRNPAQGSARDVFTAWFREKDVPRPVCVVTLFGNFVEWIHVSERFRRQGIASEVIEAIEKDYGVLNMEGATDAGEAFVEAYVAAHPDD